jgi:hypothetical protein
MTTLGKYVIVGGILVFTAGTITWILTGDWHWFAGGATLFLASVLTSAVLSAETKTTTNGHHRRQQPTQTFDPERTDPQTKPQLRIADDWQQPNSPPPDEEREGNDPFYSTPPKT